MQQSESTNTCTTQKVSLLILEQIMLFSSYWPLQINQCLDNQHHFHPKSMFKIIKTEKNIYRDKTPREIVLVEAKHWNTEQKTVRTHEVCGIYVAKHFTRPVNEIEKTCLFE